MKKAVVLSILVVAVLLAVGVIAQAQQADAPVYRDCDWWRIKSDTVRPNGWPNFKQTTLNYEDDEGASAGSRRRLSPKGPQLVPPGVANEKNKLLPSDYFRKNFLWTIETEEPEFAEAVQFLGAEHFLFATDYPHDDQADG